MNQPALDNYRGREISPGLDCQSDAELDEFVRNHAETAFHPCGTCKMGYDEMAVVAKAGFTVWKACGWWMRRLCRRSSPATSTPPPS
jgi:choline dehydrogenase-like flavoprotein